MDPIIRKIEELILTRSEAQAADYIIDHLDTIGLCTSREVASAVGVSDTSVIRLIRKLGFDSYTQFRNAMNSRISSQYQREPSEKRQGEADSGRGMVDALSGMIFENLRRTFQRLDDATIHQIVDVLLQSRHKYIAGFHTTSGCAQYMATRLVKLLPHVIPVVNADSSSVEAILDIGPEDCLVVYSFLRYSRINAPLMKLAKQNGARVILVTDRVSSPLARKADIVLLTPIASADQSYSYAAPLAVSEIILMKLIARSGTDGEARMHRVESLLEHPDLS
ncbi:MAG: MurR/RpiR family transcriptional regulator [Eubacteriales bacterium]|nr:MurR/RpiR family transcriptional regulator [Eubacteriales bacterium]